VAQAAVQAKRWRATHRFARVSTRKARLVVDLIRGQHVNAAQDILRLTSKRSSKLVEKVLRSAIANANEQEADVRSLYVSQVRVDEGPHMRRWRPKDRGRAHPILKKISHIMVEVEQR